MYTFCCLIFFLSCTKKENRITPMQQLTTSENDIYLAIRLLFEAISSVEQLEGNQYPYLVDRLDLPLFVDQNPSLKKKVITYFDQDSVSLQMQCKKWHHFKLEPQHIPFKTLLSAHDLANLYDSKATDRSSRFLQNYQKKYGNHGFYQVSIPVFSRDKKVFYIDLNTFGSGQSFLFTFKNGKWTHRVVSTWMS
jgi:hypothetical protein